ncbi:hypothetical protein RJ640_030631 [Escallonia rubra]|uniref:MADS-box domain-containing protein n=1 Tax=Escallonia rubra TaxID=112253 RepID=A0AA88UN16_9ASTE|nr:hypothetical protein RJ640_030631 [Escallonia rubra]
MKRFSTKNARQASFSKRRASLFKKASELCTLTGAEVAIILFSPGGKAFSFGHPSVDTITNRFSNRYPMPHYDNQDSHGANLSALNQRLNYLRDQLEAEEKRGEELKQMQMERQRKFWFDAPIEELNLDQLMKLQVLWEGLQKKVVDMQVARCLAGGSISAPLSSTNYAGAIDLNVATTAEMDAGVHP